MLKQEGTCREKKSEKKQESPAFKAGHKKYADTYKNKKEKTI